ncbi:MAG TPA: hypothetical protein DCQ37_14060 [Desulfobacteraceae bacterium]|nr:hypothetical protein [Desulfobacteraceae bacterium]
MKNRILTLMVMVALMGFTTFADAGMGMKGGPGMGPGKGGGCAAMKTLSAEDQAKVTAERDAFIKDTQALRDQIQQKHLELKAEMAKTDTDVQKASDMVKGITDIVAQLGQKRLQHQLNLKKINPALADCTMGGPGGMGPGHGGMGRGMGKPSCPYADGSTL